MANLIVTIISLVLVAVAAVMGIFYAGTAFQNAQIRAYANMLLSQGHQIYLANMKYTLDHGSSSFDDFTNTVALSSPYTIGLIPTLNNPVYDYSGTSEVSTCAGVAGVDGFNFMGYPIVISYSHGNAAVTGGNNVIVYNMISAAAGYTACNSTFGGALADNTHNIDLSLAAYTNHPLVQICKYINSLTTIPTGYTIAPSGLPYYTSSPGVNYAGIYAGDPNSSYYISQDTTAQNFCTLVQNGYYGSGFRQIILVIAS